MTTLGVLQEPLPPWLSIEPVAGHLYPGQKLVVTVTVDVGPASAASLLLGRSSLSLDLADGLAIRGTYAPSPFGLPLTLLCRIPRPLGSYSPAELHTIGDSFTDSSGSGSGYGGVEGGDAPMLVPKEVFLLVDHLVTLIRTRQPSLDLCHALFSFLPDALTTSTSTSTNTNNKNTEHAGNDMNEAMRDLPCIASCLLDPSGRPEFSHPPSPGKVCVFLRGIAWRCVVTSNSRAGVGLMRLHHGVRKLLCIIDV
jgi:hypothetical protein